MAADVGRAAAPLKDTKLAKKEPTKTPRPAGQPHTTKPASAKPEGGQNAVTLPGGNAIRNPSLAVR